MDIVHMGSARRVGHLRYGGATERRVKEMAQIQAKRGHSVRVFYPSASGFDDTVDGVLYRPIRCGFTPPFGEIEFQVRAARELKRLGIRADIIHYHGYPEGAALTAGLGRKQILSYDYFVFRRTRNRPHYGLYRHLLNRFDVLAPVSEYCRKESMEYWRLTHANVQILPNGVNLNQFLVDRVAGECVKRKLGIKERVVLYVGRVCRQKGIHVLLEAYSKLQAMMSGVRLVVAGPIGQFGAQTDPEGWTERISMVGGMYLGPVPETMLAAIFNMADIFVMPTIQDEMFCMAAMEAQACGKPVVASDHGGLIEVVPSNCGVRFPVGDAEALAHALCDLLRDPAKMSAYSMGAIENAAQYSWDKVVDRLEEIYALALSLEHGQGSKR